jgi:hypothetical protein
MVVDGDLFYSKSATSTSVMIMEPLTQFLNYFEFQITSGGTYFVVGLGHLRHSLGTMPGWGDTHSIGYHADDGRIYHDCGYAGGDCCGPTYGSGDRVGCGIEFDTKMESQGQHEVFFTKNGKLIGKAMKIERPAFGFYPMIGVHGAGKKVRYLGHWCKCQNLMEPMILGDSPANMWRRSNAIKFTEGGLTLENCGEGDASQDVAVAQARHPLSMTNHYFELEILNGGSLGFIAIGVGDSAHPLHTLPGMGMGGVGYHADDGRLFVEVKVAEAAVGVPRLGLICVAGDRMGCGILLKESGGSGGPNTEEEGLVREHIEERNRYQYRDHFVKDFSGDDQEDLAKRYQLDALAKNLPKGWYRIGRVLKKLWRKRETPATDGVETKPPVKEKCKVFFTKNGEKIGVVEACVPRGGFFPLVGFLSKGEKVRVDLQPLTG